MPLREALEKDIDTASRPDDEWFGVKVEQLSARLRFDPDQGQIWLEGERMIMLHLTAYAGLRRELIDTLGMKAARGLFQRMGHISGATDAALARRAKPDADLKESFMAGPRLHAIEGMVIPEPVRLEVDVETGFHAGEWIWRNSAEVEAHLETYGLSAEPVCWALTGYASGYSSAYMGRPILYREVECRAMGCARCRIVGQPAELWKEELDDDLHLGIDLEAVPKFGSSPWDKISTDCTAPPLWPQERLVGASPGFVAMMHTADRVGPTDACALILGEPGVGKKSCARVIHMKSARSRKPFVMINCAAFTSDQMDTELFGVEKTTTMPSRPGRIERARGGTLFLEDLHSLDQRAQAKLLPAIKTHEIERVGSTQPRPIDVRLIASANARLAQAVREGTFREDLYYRLSASQILIPPLRDRRGDIPLLIKHFLEIFTRRHSKSVKGLTTEAISYLLTHDFHGNIAELESMIERAIIMTPANGTIGVTYLASAADAYNPRSYRLSGRGQLVPMTAKSEPSADPKALDHLLSSSFDLGAFETELIARAVERSNGNLTKAAKLLGLTRPQLAYRYKKNADNMQVDQD